MPVLGQSESDVEDEGPLGVFPGGDAVEDLDGDAALEEVVEDDQAVAVDVGVEVGRTFTVMATVSVEVSSSTV